MFDLSGKAAFITGASKGIGREIAKTFADAGADLVLFARSAEGLGETERLVRAAGTRVLACRGDVTSREDVEAAVARALAEFGRVDILVNNAGVNVRRPVEEFADEDWERILNTNLRGPFYCARAAVPHMKKRKWGRIINLGSMMGLVALPQRTAYCASKAGLHAMTKVWALELGEHGITVNAIAAGPLLTEINRPVLDDAAANRFFLDRLPIGRWGQPGELGPLALYLASEESAFMTGAIISCDGGWTAQ